MIIVIRFCGANEGVRHWIWLQCIFPGVVRNCSELIWCHTGPVLLELYIQVKPKASRCRHSKKIQSLSITAGIGRFRIDVRHIAMYLSPNFYLQKKVMHSAMAFYQSIFLVNCRSIPPVLTNGSGEFLLWEFPLAFWMESSGYDVTYISNLDTHNDFESLTRAKGFLSVGHDE